MVRIDPKRLSQSRKASRQARGGRSRQARHSPDALQLRQVVGLQSAQVLPSGAGHKREDHRKFND